MHGCLYKINDSNCYGQENKESLYGKAFILIPIEEYKTKRRMYNEKEVYLLCALPGTVPILVGNDMYIKKKFNCMYKLLRD